ncbi:MAG: hypothetical protein ACXVCP_15630 [Bdellovibrio sp.]
MENKNPKTPKKGGGARLKKLFEEKRKNTNPNPDLLQILERQRVDEKEFDKKSALTTNHKNQLDV